MIRAGRMLLCAGVLMWATLARAQSPFQAPIGHVNDFARVLDDSARTALEQLLRTTEQKTSAEIVVATVPSLDGMSVEEYANRMFQQWGIGKKQQDNGVLVLVAPSERQMRIEVGYGLEPVLPDGLAGEIIRTEFLTRFRDGDFAGGIQNGTRHIVTIVEAHHVLTPEERERLQGSNDQGPVWVLLPFLGMFVAAGFFGIGIGLRTRTVFPILWGGIFGGGPMLMGLSAYFVVSLVVLGALAVAMAIWGYRTGARPSWIGSVRGAGSSGGGWVMGASRSGGSSSGSSSSGGSFGGGSSGGGGASGRW